VTAWVRGDVNGVRRRFNYPFGLDDCDSWIRLAKEQTCGGSLKRKVEDMPSTRARSIHRVLFRFWCIRGKRPERRRGRL